MGRWYGWADDHGDILTYWVLTDDTKQLIPVSDIHPAHLRPNQCAFNNSSSSPLLGELENISSESMGPELAPTTNTTKTLNSEHPSMDSQILKSNESHHEQLDNNSFIYLWNEDVCKVDKPEDLPRFSPSELIRRTFLYEMKNGEKLRQKLQGN